MSEAKKIAVATPLMVTVFDRKPEKSLIRNSSVLPQPPLLAPEPHDPLMALLKLPNGGLATGNAVAIANGAVTDVGSIVAVPARLNVNGASTVALPVFSSQLGETFSLTFAT